MYNFSLSRSNLYCWSFRFVCNYSLLSMECGSEYLPTVITCLFPSIKFLEVRCLSFDTYSAISDQKPYESSACFFTSLRCSFFPPTEQLCQWSLTLPDLLQMSFGDFHGDNSNLWWGQTSHVHHKEAEPRAAEWTWVVGHVSDLNAAEGRPLF